MSVMRVGFGRTSATSGWFRSSGGEDPGRCFARRGVDSMWLSSTVFGFVWLRLSFSIRVLCVAIRAVKKDVGKCVFRSEAQYIDRDHTIEPRSRYLFVVRGSYPAIQSARFTKCLGLSHRDHLRLVFLEKHGLEISIILHLSLLRSFPRPVHLRILALSIIRRSRSA